MKKKHIRRVPGALTERYFACIGRLRRAWRRFHLKQIATHRSEVLILAAVNADGSMKLLRSDGSVELGARIR